MDVHGLPGHGVAAQGVEAGRGGNLRLLERVGLADALGKKMAATPRACAAARAGTALLGRPALLVLDEPTTASTPSAGGGAPHPPGGGAEGTTLFLNSHLLAETSGV
jgi:hypothetical protein